MPLEAFWTEVEVSTHASVRRRLTSPLPGLTDERFNSRLREEATGFSWCPSALLGCFNSRLREEATATSK